MTGVHPSWTPRRRSVPVTIQDWMNQAEDRLTDLSNDPRGLGSTHWKDVELDETKYRMIGSYMPGWRRLQDSRIELRGQIERGTVNSSGTFVPEPITNGMVLMQLPFVCSPPTNEQVRTTVMSMAPCTSKGSNPGVFRIDFQRESVWREEAVLDEDGNPVLDEDGNPVIEVVSMVDVIARPPESLPISGWVAFDGVIYDPLTYIDALAPVPIGQEPLVEQHGWALHQHPDGRVEWFKPGIKNAQY